MRVSAWIAIELLCLSLTACITPSVTQKAAPGTDFKAFKTVSYSVHAARDIEIEQTPYFSQQEISMFNSSLGQRMQVMGYEVVADPAQADFYIDVAVTSAKQGSGAARFLIGFGAGRAVMTFDANFDSHGHKIASFKGGKSMTGMGPGEIFQDVDDIQNAAVTRGTRQIMEFILNSGDIPKAAPINARR
jgi:maltose-binding protein MalE